MMTHTHRITLISRAGLLIAVVALTTCGGNKSSTSGDRPSTTARLAIVSPKAGDITKPNLEVKLDLQGGQIVPASTTSLVNNAGHIHAYLDDKLVSMTYTLNQRLTALTPGPHSFRAEFVAADHIPFKNRVVAAVLFQVQR